MNKLLLLSLCVGGICLVGTCVYQYITYKRTQKELDKIIERNMEINEKLKMFIHH